MSARTLLPLITGLAVVALCAPAGAVGMSQNGQGWPSSLNVPAAWSYSKGAGVTVAVLSTGVDAAHPDLARAVISGPDFSQSGRVPGGPFWGNEGTAVASLVAGRSGIAPSSRILSIRVTLEYNDPLNGDAAIARRLPGAIASGIRYAVAHGATVIDLPLDPGSLGVNGSGQRTGDPSAAGGSPAEQSAVAFALARGAVLVAPAGDVPGTSQEFPAAYPGVIAVGAAGAAGTGLAQYSNPGSYVALTAPGTGLTVAVPPSGSVALSTTDNSAALVAGIAALIRSRFPGLTVAQVTAALEGSTGAAVKGAAGTGFGFVNAGRAMQAAAAMAPAPRASQRAAASGGSRARTTSLAPGGSAAGTLAGTVLRYAVFAAGFLILVLGAILVLGRARRARRRAAAAANVRRGSDTGDATRGRGASRARGTHASSGRKPRAGDVPSAPGSGASPAGQGRAVRLSPARPGTSRGSGSLGLNAQTRGQRPALVPVPKAGPGRRLAIGRGSSPGEPPWEPAPPPPAPFPSLAPPTSAVSDQLPEPDPFTQPGSFTGQAGPPSDGPDDFLPLAAPPVRAIPDVPGGLHNPWSGPERFVAAPVPPDLPDWGNWNPGATTESFPAVRFPDPAQPFPDDDPPDPDPDPGRGTRPGPPPGFDR